MSPDARISETDDSATHVLLQTDGSDLIHLFAISNVEGPDSHPLDSQTPKHQILNTILLRDFRSAYEGLNLKLLSTDLTVVGYSE